MPPVDQGLPTLLADLEQRGMLDTTLVVWLTDFGRTPQINTASGRDHWATAACVVMAGVGVPGGSVVGRTDAEGGQPIDSPYYPEDVAATIYAKLGIPLDLMLRTPDGRPIRMNEGQPIRQWM
jgi:arylsulfatase A-like enzyme